VLLVGTSVSAVVLAVVGLVPRFWTVIALLAVWALMSAAMTPVRQAYLNGLIASRERATILSFDSLLASGGAVGIQPILGRAADVWGYPASYLCSSAIQVLAIPFFWRARSERAASDAMVDARVDETRSEEPLIASSGSRNSDAEEDGPR
jgi:MFS family permease